jgi:hypothetical protein
MLEISISCQLNITDFFDDIADQIPVLNGNQGDLTPVHLPPAMLVQPAENVKVGQELLLKGFFGESNGQIYSQSVKTK